jgi:hypothetical protein
LARSEAVGYAVNKCPGKMEYWNVGILGLAEGDPFYNPNISFFQHSSIPLII